MADASADVADPVDRARERLEQAVTHLEAAFASASEKSDRERRDVEVLSAENAELKQGRESRTSRDAQVVQRLTKAIERLRAVIEEQP